MFGRLYEKLPFSPGYLIFYKCTETFTGRINTSLCFSCKNSKFVYKHLRSHITVFASFSALKANHLYLTKKHAFILEICSSHNPRFPLSFIQFLQRKKTGKLAHFSCVHLSQWPLVHFYCQPYIIMVCLCHSASLLPQDNYATVKKWHFMEISSFLEQYQNLFEKHSSMLYFFTLVCCDVRQ